MGELPLIGRGRAVPRCKEFFRRIDTRFSAEEA
jgi:hypothetical protein